MHIRAVVHWGAPENYGTCCNAHAWLAVPCTVARLLMMLFVQCMVMRHTAARTALTRIQGARVCASLRHSSVICVCSRRAAATWLLPDSHAAEVCPLTSSAVCGTGDAVICPKMRHAYYDMVALNTRAVPAQGVQWTQRRYCS
eukprot:TRINITY_DN896_c0_g1_i5.p1 TRINITY_DN896_c0_g1~~TRINITY_DN896_c0_g1_i5.p1  ORF type:complete len:143 (-),score=5.59 TRINITY_DN896_c0_g1_i5:584-1012(-)